MDAFVLGTQHFYPGFLPRGTIRTEVKGRETQAGDGGLTELRRQRSESGAQST